MYGLIGEKLGHSFSKEIHEQLANYIYDLIPLSHDEFPIFMNKKEFQAINVTIPYKKDVIPYLDQIDEQAKNIGAVNTIVQKNGKLIGHNTDYDGFLYLLKHHHISVKNKKVMVLGNGGAAQAVKAVLHDQQVKEMILVKSRPSPETITYEEAYKHHTDVEVIINTSPIGMYPNNDNPINLRYFSNCKEVIDVIYNPLRTSLIMQAKQLHMNAVGGLEMLVAQAKVAVEYFLDVKIPDTRIDEIYRSMLLKQCNIVLIGMPSCGKSTVGKQLANILHKEFVDSDEEIVTAAGKSIKDVFQEDGEEAFRDLEEQVLQRIAMKHNQVIATGGGCIKRENNIIHLKQNGYVLFLDRAKELLVTEDAERPLSNSKESVYQMYDDRFPRYLAFCDLRIKNDKTPEDAVDEIHRLLHTII